MWLSGTEKLWCREDVGLGIVGLGENWFEKLPMKICLQIELWEGLSQKKSRITNLQIYKMAEML